MKVLRPQGKICPIAAMPENTPVDLNMLRPKCASLLWELMFTRSTFCDQGDGMPARYTSEILTQIIPSFTIIISI